MKNNDKQITGTKECETSYHVFIFKEVVNKELKKNDVKIEANIVSVILFCRETISVFSHIIFMVLSYKIYFFTSSWSVSSFNKFF